MEILGSRCGRDEKMNDHTECTQLNANFLN